MSLTILAQIAAHPAETNSPVSPAWNFGRLVDLNVEKGELVLSVGPVLIAVMLVGLIVLWWWRRLHGAKFRQYEVVKYTLKVANIGEVEIIPNTENIRIAYQAWIELTTRKVALPFDETNDVIVDVYNSCYEVFGRLRDLAKSIPAHHLRESEDTRKLVEVMIKVLNEGLRPHLTSWQAKFRRWYSVEVEKEENKSLPPQQIQKKYPAYAELVTDLKKVHEDVVDYVEFLRQMVEGEKLK